MQLTLVKNPCATLNMLFTVEIPFEVTALAYKTAFLLRQQMGINYASQFVTLLTSGTAICLSVSFLLKKHLMM